MADVVARSTQPTLAAIKLAWWRERLEELDQGKVPAEPRLCAASAELLPRGITGAELGDLEQNWAAMLRTDQPDTFKHGVGDRGAALFRLAARLLDIDPDDDVRRAGQAYSSVDVARRGMKNLSPFLWPVFRNRASRRVRPLTAFAALAYRDMRRGGAPFEPEGTPGRAWTLLRHRLTGIV